MTLCCLSHTICTHYSIVLSCMTLCCLSHTICTHYSIVLSCMTLCYQSYTSCTHDICAGPIAHSYRLGLVTWRYQVRIPFGPNICHHGCTYTVSQTVQRPVVYSAAYGNVHYKEASKSFEIRVGHSPGFVLSSVAILP